MSRPFNLDAALGAWRRTLTHRRVILSDDLDELEQHVRDEVAARVAAGATPEEAFAGALRAMGEPGEMEDAYRRVFWGKLRRTHRLVHELRTDLLMLGNYLRVALRHLLKRKGFAFINILGLALGLAAALLLLQYVRYELSYDDFHERADRLYRVRYDALRDGQELFRSATTFPGVGPALEADFPEVESSARLFLWYGGGVVRHGDRSFREDRLFSADSTFLTMFSYPMLRGDARSALVRPNTAVLSAEAAARIFGEADPVGERIRFGNDQEYEITGVAASPETSHLKFDFLFSFSTMPQIVGESLERGAWGWYDFYTYILLQPGADPGLLEAQLPAFIARHTSEEQARRRLFSLQAVPDIHLHSDLIQEARVNGNATTVYFLGLVALLVLLIAWVNYVNLSTARALERAKEVGIRKVAGAHRRQLVAQFILESAWLNLLAAGLALALVWLARPFFIDLVGLPAAAAPSMDGVLWAFFGGLFLAGVFLSGLYPAFVLSSYRPAAVLKGSFSRARSGLRLRKVLVVAQFAASIGLIAGTIIVYQQLRFMESQSLGFEIERTLVVDGPQVVETDSLHADRLDLFKQALAEHLNIRSAAASTEIPGNLIYWTNGASRLQDDGSDSFILYLVGVDAAYLDGYAHRVVAGRAFDENRGTEASSVVLNETAVRSFGLASAEEAIGERVRIGGDTLTVAGVVADFHQEGLRKGFDPIAFRWGPTADEYFSLHLAGTDLSETLAHVEAAYGRFFPGNPFTYTFLDDHFDAQYRPERQFGEAFGVFALLAIGVACLGLFGLSSFVVTQRTKEIGIRKVLGSSTSGIVLLLTGEFARLVLASSLLAVPVVWLLMERWLDRFAFRIDVALWPFAVAAILALALAYGTVGWQSLRAAAADPARTLRYE